MNPRWNNLEERLRNALEKNSATIPDTPSNRTAAAVLVPFVFADGEWHLLFTRRTSVVATHRGEISFPGGGFERGDKDLVQTAIRETCEEIGICDEPVNVLGVMAPVPTVSNYCVLPVVGVIHWPQPLTLNQEEVETAFLIPVEWLSREENWYTSDFFFAPGQFRKVIHYRDYNGQHLWGITAALTQKILAEI